MPIRKVPLTTGEYYHVFNRTIGKRYIFLEKKFNNYFLQLIDYYKTDSPSIRFSLYKRLAKGDQQHIRSQLKSKKQRVKVLSYCLMPTHFHFLLEQLTDGGISSFIGTVLNVFVQYYNKRNATNGPLFLPRFKAVHIDNDMLIKHVSRYIHLNPFSSGIVSNRIHLENYPWSSYGEYLGRGYSTICDTNLILNMFRNDRYAYKRFIDERSAYQKTLEKLKHINKTEINNTTGRY